MLNLKGKRVKEHGSPLTRLGIRAQKVFSPGRIARSLTHSNFCGGSSKNVKAFANTYRIAHTTVEGCETLTAEQCWSRFPTVNDFFTRRRINLPPPSKSPAYAAYLLKQFQEATGQTTSVRQSGIGSFQNRLFVSPADNFAVYLNGAALRKKVWIKGEHFSVQGLFAQPKLTLNDHQLMIFRLAPQHYHRFHSPVTGRVRSLYYTGSEYFSVNPIVVRSKLDALTRNVRLVMEIENAYGEIVHMAIIGATCVGSIEITHPSILATLKRNRLFARNLEQKVVFDNPPAIRATDELGNFQFGGSCVALYFPGSYSATRYGQIVQRNTLQRREPLETELEVGQVLFFRSV